MLRFHRQIIKELVEEDGLLVLARGLGLRKVVSGLLKIYDSPTSLVLLVNASGPEEEQGLSDDLRTFGVSKGGLRMVRFDLDAKTRGEMYKEGGILSVTTRILVVDMLNGIIPIELITGLLILHSEKVTPTSNEAFVVRLFRQTNKKGFIKAFSDEPESLAQDFAPLQTTLRQLQLRKVFLWPRFHQEIIDELGKRKADVVELHQPLTRSMDQIQNGIIECIEACLSELGRGNSQIELEQFTVENALFRSFDTIIRRQLDPIWHRVSAKSKQLVTDLSTLRTLLNYLLSYDCVLFNSFLDTILSSNTINEHGRARQNQSPWLFMDSANTIFDVAKKRVMVPEPSTEKLPEVMLQPPKVDSLPPGQKAVLEELPKWSLLCDVLDEIDTEMSLNPPESERGTSTVLVMCETERTCTQLKEFLSSRDRARPGEKSSRPMMERELRNYVAWKKGLRSLSHRISRLNDQEPSEGSDRSKDGLSETSAGLKRKEAINGRGQPWNKRRRVRGGGSAGLATVQTGRSSLATVLSTEAAEITALGNVDDEEPHIMAQAAQEAITDEFDEIQYNDYFGILSMESIVMVKPYARDEDDHLLEELRPRFIIMYDPDPAFVRRVEVFRTGHPGLGVRVYFMIYSNSVEEQRYLSQMRKEKEAFERLIRERGTMVIPMNADGTAALGTDDQLLRTINSRIAGGGKTAIDYEASVVTDMREFRSSLPSLLHAVRIKVVPCTLQVGDYILNPSMVVERKSVPDLISSFQSGRLYTQADMMSVHYRIPILLIEFSADKAFSLDSSANDQKHQAAVQKALPDKTDIDLMSLTSRLVMLTISFPRLRLIWSSSPYQTADIFTDLKIGYEEPNADKASQIGSGVTEDVMVDSPGNDVLRYLPCITDRNMGYVRSRVQNLSELCLMEESGMASLIGVEPAKKLHKFINGTGR